MFFILSPVTKLIVSAAGDYSGVENVTKAGGAFGIASLLFLLLVQS